MKVTINTPINSLSVHFFDKKRLKSENTATLKNNGFEAKNAQMVVDNQSLYVGTIGVKTSDDWRILGTKVTEKLKSMKVKSANIIVPKNCGAFVEGLVLGDYSFDKYKSQKKKSTLKTINLVATGIKQTVTEAVARAEAQCSVRDLVNETPENCNSITIEDDVIKMFKGTDVSVKVYGEKALKKMGANGILSVNQASKYPAKIIRLQYIPSNWKKHNVFVGKFISYDTGGSDLKTDGHMKNMKTDMAGGAIQIGMMQYVAKYGSSKKVTVYVCIAENMLNELAYKADDIITEMNGKTIMIINSDAEGRMALISGLGLAQKENKDISRLYTTATLTGHQVMAFGPHTATLVGFNEKIKKEVVKAGKNAGESFVSAPFNKYMLHDVDGDIADVNNLGNTPTQGCQKAGLFLTKFISKKNNNVFTHIDVAGPSRADSDWGSNVKGATGFGTRTLIQLVK